jgi:hypothetical protein
MLIYDPVLSQFKIEGEKDLNKPVLKRRATISHINRPVLLVLSCRATKKDNKAENKVIITTPRIQ